MNPYQTIDINCYLYIRHQCWPSQIYKEYTYLDSDGYMRIGNR